jgi:hypothetical protein
MPKVVKETAPVDGWLVGTDELEIKSQHLLLKGNFWMIKI